MVDHSLRYLAIIIAAALVVIAIVLLVRPARAEHSRQASEVTREIL